MKKIVALCMALWLTPAIAEANMTIIVGGPHLLQQNLAGQVVPIFVVSDTPDTTQGLAFNAQLGDGGPDVGGSDVTPLMTGDAIGPGTLFELNHNAQNDGSAPPSFVNLGFTTQSGTVPIPVGASLLAVLTFDTTGFVEGVWPLLLSGTVNGDTQILGTTGALSIVNGEIFVEPEPSSAVLAGLSLVGLVAWSWRKRRVTPLDAGPSSA